MGRGMVVFLGSGVGEIGGREERGKEEEEERVVTALLDQ